MPAKTVAQSDNVVDKTVKKGRRMCFWSRQRGSKQHIPICGKIQRVDEAGSFADLLVNGKTWTVGFNYLVPFETFDTAYFTKKNDLYPPTRGQKSDYNRSVTTQITPLPPAIVGTAHTMLTTLGQCLYDMRDEEDKTRYAAHKTCVEQQSNAFISLLNDTYAITTPVRVSPLEGKINVKGMSVNGYHFTQGDSERLFINIRTEAQNRIVSKKRYLSTMLHEWMHHHDYHALKIANSYHTKGFFDRINAVYNQVKTVYD